MKTFLFRVLIFSIPLPFLIYGMAFKTSSVYFWELNRILRDNPAVILLGSSVNDSTSDQDTDKRSISEILDAAIDPRVASVSHAAYHADIYSELCRYITMKPEKPAIIITEINLRSFSPEWDMRPQYQFVKERRLLHGFPFFRPSIYTIDEQTFKNTPVFQYNKVAGTVDDFLYLETAPPIEAARGGFIFHYSYALDPRHRKLASLKEISDTLSGKHVIPLFFIAPIDYLKAEAVLGKEFTVQIKKNTDTIKSILARTGATVLDFSLSLDSSYFDYRKIPGEHLNQRGRKFVALSLATSVKAFLR